VTALDEPFAAISATDISGCKQVSNLATLIAALFAAWQIFF
jgi:hypothetical protein